MRRHVNLVTAPYGGDRCPACGGYGAIGEGLAAQLCPEACRAGKERLVKHGATTGWCAEQTGRAVGRYVAACREARMSPSLGGGA